MKSLTLESLHYALSLFSDESHIAVIKMLEKDHGINMLDSSCTLSPDVIRRGLESIFGTGTSILLKRIDEYNSKQLPLNNGIVSF
jgi:hypothetical protein